MFDAERLKEIGLDARTLYPTVLARPPPLDVNTKDVRVSTTSSWVKSDPVYAEDVVRSVLSEEEHELRDAMSPIYDCLSLAKAWWAAEVLPIKQPDKERKEVRRFNWGRGRVIPDGIKVHRSVKMRIEAGRKESAGKGYKPRSKLVESQIEWVD